VLARPLRQERKAKKAKFEIVDDSPSEKSVSDNFSQKDSVSYRRNFVSDSRASEPAIKLHGETD